MVLDRRGLDTSNGNGSKHAIGSDSRIDITDRFSECRSRVDSCFSLRLSRNKLVRGARNAAFRRGHARSGSMTQTWRCLGHHKSGSVTALQNGAAGHGEGLGGAMEFGEVFERFGRGTVL